MSKPFKGRLYNWRKVKFDTEKVKKYYKEDVGLGFYIAGYTSEVARLGTAWNTSWVVSMKDDGMIETRNSLYQLVGPEYVPQA